MKLYILSALRNHWECAPPKWESKTRMRKIKIRKTRYVRTWKRAAWPHLGNDFLLNWKIDASWELLWDRPQLLSQSHSFLGVALSQQPSKVVIKGPSNFYHYGTSHKNIVCIAIPHWAGRVVVRFATQSDNSLVQSCSSLSLHRYYSSINLLYSYLCLSVSSSKNPVGTGPNTREKSSPRMMVVEWAWGVTSLD